MPGSKTEQLPRNFTFQFNCSDILILPTKTDIDKETQMNNTLKTGFMLILTVLMLVSCASNNPYNDPDSQRDRAKKAQDEMSRDMSK